MYPVLNLFPGVVSGHQSPKPVVSKPARPTMASLTTDQVTLRFGNQPDPHQPLLDLVKALVVMNTIDPKTATPLDKTKIQLQARLILDASRMNPAQIPPGEWEALSLYSEMLDLLMTADLPKLWDQFYDQWDKDDLAEESDFKHTIDTMLEGADEETWNDPDFVDELMKLEIDRQEIHAEYFDRLFQKLAISPYGPMNIAQLELLKIMFQSAADRLEDAHEAYSQQETAEQEMTADLDKLSALSAENLWTEFKKPAPLFNHSEDTQITLGEMSFYWERLLEALEKNEPALARHAAAQFQRRIPALKFDLDAEPPF